MILTYHPEGQDEPKVWTINLGKFRVGDMEAIERRTKMSFGKEFRPALMAGNSTARRALLWTLLRRDHNTLRYEDVDFADDELVLEMDKEEWGRVRADVERNTAVSEETLAAIDAELAAAPEAPGKAPTPSATSETSTD